MVEVLMVAVIVSLVSVGLVSLVSQLTRSVVQTSQLVGTSSLESSILATLNNSPSCLATMQTVTLTSATEQDLVIKTSTGSVVAATGTETPEVRIESVKANPGPQTDGVNLVSVKVTTRRKDGKGFPSVRSFLVNTISVAGTLRQCVYNNTDSWTLLKAERRSILPGTVADVPMTLSNNCASALIPPGWDCQNSAGMGRTLAWQMSNTRAKRYFANQWDVVAEGNRWKLSFNANLQASRRPEATPPPSTPFLENNCAWIYFDIVRGSTVESELPAGFSCNDAQTWVHQGPFLFDAIPGETYSIRPWLGANIGGNLTNSDAVVYAFALASHVNIEEYITSP